jgi:putative hydrolase of the HAD superfamily
MVASKAVVFDLDDTLIAERDYIVSGFTHIADLVSSGDPIVQQDVYAFLVNSLENDTRRDVFDRLVATFPSCRDLAVSDLVSAYRTHKPSIDLLPGVSELLQDLRQGGIRLGVISDGWAVAQRAKVEALALGSLVDQIVLTDEYGRDYWKPHERAFCAMEDSFGLKPNEIVYVADNVSKDFIAPNRRGWRTIRFKHDRCLYWDVPPPNPEAEPSAEVSSVAELSQLLRNWIISQQ